MKSLVRGTSALFFAAAILFATTQPVLATAFPGWYDWHSGEQLVTDPRNAPALSAGQDIRNASYALKDGYRYFRMELFADPNESPNGYANLYGFFIQTGKGNKYTEFTSPLGFNVDSFLNLEIVKLFDGGLKSIPDGRTYYGSVPGEKAFGLEYDRNGKYLDWAIPQTQLPDNFTWVAATFQKGSWLVLNQTAAVATPIPSAALLLGTGLIGLVGLRRRSVRKA